ncbi:hypothetical protein KEM56_000872 [Ascosphaera pollenicola]|nr:hypothetical protein KEM56_000872 [Ascosphaera pollenicola]
MILETPETMSTSTSAMPNYGFNQVRHKTGRPLEYKASEIIEEIAARVTPVLMKYRWTIGWLKEFYPD